MATRVYAANPDATEGAKAAQGNLSSTTLIRQGKNITNTLLVIVGVLAVIMIIIGGFLYILSAGNEKATTGTKDTIIYAVVGLIVTLLAFAIVNFVLGIF